VSMAVDSARCAQRHDWHWWYMAFLAVEAVRGGTRQSVQGFGGCREISVFGRRLGVICAFWLVGGILPAAAKDIALVSNKSNGLQSITLADLTKACKGQMNRWSDGRPVTVVILDPEASEMKIVLQKVYEQKADDVKALIASANHGRANHPAIVVATSEQDLVRKVESTPGAVGLVDVYSITSGVTVVKIGGKDPFDPGYPLHGN
jgi:periplasmic binding family protein